MQIFQRRLTFESSSAVAAPPRPPGRTIPPPSGAPPPPWYAPFIPTRGGLIGARAGGDPWWLDAGESPGGPRCGAGAPGSSLSGVHWVGGTSGWTPSPSRLNCGCHRPSSVRPGLTQLITYAATRPNKTALCRSVWSLSDAFNAPFRPLSMAISIFFQEYSTRSLNALNTSFIRGVHSCPGCKRDNQPMAGELVSGLCRAARGDGEMKVAIGADMHAPKSGYPSLWFVRCR